MDQPAAVVARALRDPAGPPPAWSGADADAVIASTSQHRVLLLLGWMLRSAGTLDQWPAEFVDAFRLAERQSLFVDCLRHVELVMMLGELDAAGVRAILFKGAALAHTHYPAPHVRPRADTDVLVPAEQMPAVEAVLSRLGYGRPAETSGDLVSYQSHYHKPLRHGVTHAVDVHWKISNFQSLASRFTHEELWQRRVAVESLGPTAVTVDDPHALLLALVHRAGHHRGSTNLLWIYDFLLLRRRLTDAQMQEVHEIAAARGLRELADEGLSRADDWFGGTATNSAAAIEQPWTQAQVLRLDLQALPDWRMRSRLLRQHLLPSASYIRAKYGVRSDVALPALYVWRVLRGVPKWFRRADI